MILLRVHLGTSFEKVRLAKTTTKMVRRISRGNFIITMITPSKTPPSPGKPSPSRQVCVVSLESLHCAYCKKTGHFCSNFCREKSIFECMIGGAALCPVLRLSNESNDGHLSLWQGLLVVLVPMSFSSGNSTVVFVEMLALAERALARATMLSCLCADVNNTSHDSCCLQHFLHSLLFSCSLDGCCCCLRQGSSIQTWLFLWWQSGLVAHRDGARGLNLSDDVMLYSWLGFTSWLSMESTEECCPGAIGCEVSDEVSCE